MELQRAGLALLRAQRTVAPDLLRSAFPSRRQFILRTNCSRRTALPSSRKLSSTAHRSQDDPFGVSPTLQMSRSKQTREQRRKSLFANHEGGADGFNKIMDSTPPTRQSSSPSAMDAHRRLEKEFTPRNQTFGASQNDFGNDWAPRPDRKGQTLDLGLLQFSKPQNSATSITSAIAPPPPENLYPRLSPVLGREIAVRRGELSSALGRLNGLIIRNRIKSDAFRQKFHERGGLKRKRLKSERWRMRFRDGFHHVTQRVTRFVNQGW